MYQCGFADLRARIRCGWKKTDHGLVHGRRGRLHGSDGYVSDYSVLLILRAVQGLFLAGLPALAMAI